MLLSTITEDTENTLSGLWAGRGGNSEVTFLQILKLN